LFYSLSEGFEVEVERSLAAENLFPTGQTQTNAKDFNIEVEECAGEKIYVVNNFQGSFWVRIF